MSDPTVTVSNEPDLSVDTHEAKKRVRKALKHQHLALPPSVLDTVVTAAVENLVPGEIIAAHRDQIDELLDERSAAVKDAFTAGMNHRNAQGARVNNAIVLIDDVKALLSRVVAWSGPEDWKDQTMQRLDELQGWLKRTDPEHPDTEVANQPLSNVSP